MTQKNVNDSSKKVEEAKKIAQHTNDSDAFEGVEEVFFRFFRWLSNLIDRLFFGRRNIVLFSLVLAIIIYVVVNIQDSAITGNLSSSRTINDVTVTARYNSESFEVSGLPTSCDVVLTGEAANVNNAATKTGYCLINLEGYTEGTHTVDLTASGYGDSVKSVVVPSETQVTLKRKTTAQFDLGYDFINKNELDSKLILGTPVFDNSLSKVNVRASQDTLNSIAMVKALIDVGGKTDNFTGEAKLVAYNKTGSMVDVEIVPSVATFSLEIKEHKKEVPITLKVKGDLPLGYGLDAVSLDRQSTYIYAPLDVLDAVDEVTVELDLSSITTASNVMQQVILPQGVNASDVTMVNIQYTLAETVTKEIDDVPIVYRNNDNNLGASAVDTTTVKVIVTGTASNIEDITASDCVAYIDLKDSEGNLLEPGKYELSIVVEKNTSAYVTFSCEPNNLNITLVGQD